MKKTGKNIACTMLALLMMLALAQPPYGMTAQAAEGGEHQHDDACGYSEAAPCGHVHNEECGFAQGSEGTPCTFTHEHDEACGYSTEAPEGCTFDPASHVHDEACGYAEDIPDTPCGHTHDEVCGYAEGAPCNFQPEPDPATPTQIIIAALDPLGEAVLQQGFDAGEIDGQEELALPGTLAGVDAEGGALSIEGVSWACAAADDMLGEPFETTAFDPATEGIYTFAPTLPGGYSLADGVSLPQITVTIAPMDGLMMPMSTPAGQTFEENGVLYTVLTNAEDNRTAAVAGWGTGGAQASLTVPATASDGTDTYKVTEIASGAFNGDQTLTALNLANAANLALIERTAFLSSGLSGTLAIPPGVARIQIDAFSLTKKLTALELPQTGSLKIDMGAFEGSGISGTLTITPGVSVIGESAFANCGKITSLVLPQTGSLTIGDFAFSGTRIAGALVIPPSVTHIGEQAFSRLAITSLTLPQTGSLHIGDEAFSYTGITGALVIPAGVASIGVSAFYNTGISGTLILPSSVTAVGNSAFSGTGITTVDLRSFSGTLGADLFFASPVSALYFGLQSASGYQAAAFNNLNTTPGTAYYPSDGTGYTAGEFAGGALSTWTFTPASATGITYSAVQVGGAPGIKDSTGIQITFSEPVSGLTASSIFIQNGMTGKATKGSLSGNGVTWTIALDSVDAEGDVFITILDFGDVTIADGAGTQSVAVYKSIPLSVSYTATQVGGTSGTKDSTGIEITFSAAVVGLTAADITLTNFGGGATKGSALSGSGVTWTISLDSVLGEGALFIDIADFGNVLVSDRTKSVTVFKDTRPLAFSGAGVISIPASVVGRPIANIDVSGGVAHGAPPYTFTASGLPAGITLSAAGILSGAPTTAGPAGIATLTVTDSALAQASTDISVGEVYAADQSFEENGVLYTVLTTTPERTAAVMGWGAAGPQPSLTVPATASNGTATYDVTAIAYAAFYGDETLTTLDMTGATNLEEIGAAAFRDSSLSGRLSLPPNLIIIGTTAFAGLYNVSGTLVIPPSVTTIDVMAFSGTLITGLVLPQTGSLAIEELAFSSCSLSGTLVITPGVSEIEERAFESSRITALDLRSAKNALNIFKEAFQGNAIDTIYCSQQAAPVFSSGAFSGIRDAGRVYYPQGGTGYTPAEFAKGALPGWTFSPYGEGDITFTATQVGGTSGTANSTAIELTFSQPISGLTQADVLLSDAGGAAERGAVTGSGNVWQVALDDVLAEGPITVRVSRGGYQISPLPVSTMVYKDMRQTVSYTAVQVGGVSGVKDSTGIKITFSQAVSGLTAGSVLVRDGASGKATQGSLSGSGTTWTIALDSVEAEGDVFVTILSFGLVQIADEGSTQSVAVYKNTLPPLTYTAAQAGGTSGSVDSTGITITFNRAVSGLTAADITITPLIGSVVKGALTGSGTTWTLALTRVTSQGIIALSIADFGEETLGDRTKNVTVYKNAVVSLSYTAVQVGGASGTADTTGILITFSDGAAGISADDISITGATKGALGNNSDADPATWLIGISGITMPNGGTIGIDIGNFASATVTTPAQDVVVYRNTSGPTAPGAPTGLTATPGNGRVDLTWTAPAGNGGSAITGYKVSTDDGATWTATGSTGTSYTVTGLANGTPYTIRVRAVNAIGDGTPSGSITATPAAAATVPGAPTGLTATPGDGRVDLTWTAPASNGGSAITGYKVSADNGATWTATGSTGTSYTVTGLANGTTYTIRVRAVNAIGDGAASGSITATPAAAATVPGAPTGLSATPGNGRVDLTWTAPASNGGRAITGYKVSTDNGATWAPTASTGTSYTATGLTNGTPYTIRVRAVNAIGDGAASDSVTATPAAAVYGISLGKTGTHTFPGANVGYGAQTALTVRVSNTGNQPTGALTVGLSGANAGSFNLSKTSIGNIAVPGNGTFTVRPNTGLAAGTYTAAVTVSGGNGITASFNISFTVTQAAGTHTITATAGPNGSISPAGSVSVSDGGSQTFTITPGSGYKVSDVLVDGTSVGAVNRYTFADVRGNHTVAATFELRGGDPGPPSSSSSAPGSSSQAPPPASSSSSGTDSSSSSSSNGSPSSSQPDGSSPPGGGTSNTTTPADITLDIENMKDVQTEVPQGSSFFLSAPEGSLAWDETMLDGRYDAEFGGYVFTPLKAGETIITYTDENGDEHALTMEIIPPETPLAGADGTDGGFPWWGVLLAVVLLGGGGALWLVLAKRRKKE